MTRHTTAGLGTYPLEYAALGLLFAGPQHGYRLYQVFSRELRQVWKAGQANFYLALASLEARGRVTASAEPQEGRPARKVYAITEAGRDAFLDWLNTPVHSMRAFRVEFIARLRFFALLDLPGADALIAQEIAFFTRLLDEWDQALTDDLAAALLADYRRRQARMIVDWLLAWQAQFLPTSPHGG